MATILFQPPACLLHDTGPDHPETAERLLAIEKALEHERFSDLIRTTATKATFGQIERVHTGGHIEHLLSETPKDGTRYLDSDTAISAQSIDAALYSVGAVCEGIDSVIAGQARNAFCAIRPPGHHAEPDQAMGFCLFNNVAVGAAHARAMHNVTRIAALDFDVHHGNGTQAFFWPDPNLFYASSHQSPCWPDTGEADECGVANNIVNVPLAPGAGSEDFRKAWGDVILPQLSEFAPELILISAGFDAHSSDPQAQLRVTTADFEWLTAEILGVANSCCRGQVVSVLEGGYNTATLGPCVATHVNALMTC